MIEWLAAQGATAEHVIEAKEISALNALSALAGDLALRGPGERLTVAQIAVLAGMPPERIEDIRRAMGLPPAKSEEWLFNPDDVGVFASVSQATEIFGEAPTLFFMRVVGSSLARVARHCGCSNSVVPLL